MYIMKIRGLFLIPTMLMAYGATAQQFVSTTASTRNVVLEEFTGIKCGWCPAGHKIADQMAATYNTNGVRFVPINIHVGSFAVPSAGQPDFRTNFGQAINNYAGVTGYPAGSVSRTVFSGITHQTSGKSAMSRSSWSNAAGQLINMASPVNIAVKAEYNPIDNKLYILTEAYYTGNSVMPTNRITIGINQNDIWGPQSGNSNYPEMWDQSKAPNGYRHKHMLRHLLTDQWGDLINTTTQGTFVQKYYTYTVPNDINGVAMVPADLEVFAFIAEGQDNVLTGTVVKIEVMQNGANGTNGAGEPMWYSLATNTEVKAPTTATVALYPNPVSNNMTIRFQNVDVKSMTIFNIAGQQVLMETVQGRENVEINVEHLPAGIYTVVYSSDVDKVAPQKFVKQ
jgi:thiol-disulfide isomerase/thioredoxin